MYSWNDCENKWYDDDGDDDDDDVDDGKITLYVT